MKLVLFRIREIKKLVSFPKLMLVGYLKENNSAYEGSVRLEIALSLLNLLLR